MRRYRTLGGLKGAIGDRAAHVVRELPPGVKRALPRLFQALVHVDAEGTATRRRADRTEAASDEMATHLLDALIDARLLQGGEREGRATIEVAHEAVFEGWPRLREWLADNRTLLLRRAEVEAAMARWERAQRDPEFLLPPGRWLNEAVDLVRERPDLLLPGMKGYVEASQEFRLTQTQEDQKRLRRESMRLAELSQQETAGFLTPGRTLIGIVLALEALPNDLDHPDRPYVAAAEEALYQALRGDQELGVLRSHSAAVNSAAFSPDGQQIITASRDGTARLWSAATAKGTKILQDDAALFAAAFSPDGRLIATASWDSIARIWNANSGRCAATLQGHRASVVAVMFSPDGQRIITASCDGTARLWDANSGEEVGILKGHTDAVNSAAFSPDGRYIITGSADGTVRMWSAATRRLVASLGEGRGTAVVSATFSADGRRIVTASADAIVRLWEVDAPASAPIITFNNGALVNAAALSPDGRRIATASADAAVRLWDATSGDRIAILRGHKKDINSVAFDPVGQRVVSASRDGTACIWRVFRDTHVLVDEARRAVATQLSSGDHSATAVLPPN